MTIDANLEDRQERRRRQFTQWLMKCWEWATDNGKMPLACRLATLVSHANEEDYPLWEMAHREHIIGDSKDFDLLRKACGLPPPGPQPTNWEREINFCPVIALEPEVFQRVYNSLGWSNRFVDLKYPGTNFWLWSDSGNLVRFVKREPVKEAKSE